MTGISCKLSLHGVAGMAVKERYALYEGRTAETETDLWKLIVNA